jgi:hypothetical protein
MSVVLRESLGFYGESLGDFIESLWEFYGASLGILWSVFGISPQRFYNAKNITIKTVNKKAINRADPPGGVR